MFFELRVSTICLYFFTPIRYNLLLLHYYFAAEPIVEDNTHVNDIEYSPLVCGFGITLNDGRAAYLTAPNLKFDPNVSTFY